MQNALTFKRNQRNSEEYVKFISHFGPALTGTTFWNNNKTTKLVSELLTISDEAFIHLCIINYSATWKAQEKKKLGETAEEVPVSRSLLFSLLVMILNKNWLTAFCRCQSPRFTKATQKGRDGLVGRARATNLLPCGWSKDGLQTYNQIAKEIISDRKEHGEEFDNAFKTSIEQEIASSAINKTGKRKRHCVDTYNDLNEGELIMKGVENSDDEEDEQWVAKNLFMV